MSKGIQNILLAFAMACSVTAWFSMAGFSIMSVEFFHIPVVWIVLFIASIIVAEDVRNAFKKVLWFEKRSDKRPIWQVGVGMLFFLAQVGFVETFMHNWMPVDLGGMPLYFIFSFMNAFLATVIFEEIFYEEQRPGVQKVKYK